MSPLLVGETIPFLKSKNADEKVVNLKKIINEKPSVLIFYCR